MQVPGSCPWYLFADKYEKLLIGRGLIQKRGTAAGGISAEESLTEAEQMKIAIGRIEGLVEANKTELTPLLYSVVSLKNGTDSVDAKLQKLVVLGKIGAVCLVLVTVLVVVGLIIMLVK